MDTYSQNPRSKNIKAELQAELEELEQQEQGSQPGEYALIRNWPKMLVTLLAVCGLFVAGYLALHETHILGGPLICTTNGDCDDVNNSVYGFWFGIPVSVYGTAGYLGIVVTALAGLRLLGPRLLLAANLQLAFATLGLLASAYFTSIEAFVLNKWCQWCVASAIIMTLIFVLSILDRLSVKRVVYVDEPES